MKNNPFIVALTVLMLTVTPIQLLHSESGAETALISNLAIPESLGKIQERFVGTGSRWVIDIQDIHAHVPAQENISAIIDHLNAVYGIKAVALEGGWLSTTFPKSWGLPNSRGKQNLARYLLESGFLTGPGYAALFSQTPIQLVGVEDPTPYEENRQAYLKYLAMENSVKEKIKNWESDLNDEKSTVFNPDLLKFEMSLSEFRDGKQADRFLPRLIALSDSKEVDTKDLPQVNLFKQILSAEANLLKDKLQSEAERLMGPFKKTRLSFEEVLRSGKIEAQQLDMYPEVKKYTAIMKLNDQLDHKKLFEEIDILIEKVKAVLMTNDQEKALDAKLERFLTAKRMMLMKATPDDMDKFQMNASAIQNEMTEAGLSDALNISMRFYELAQKRDQIFFDKLMSDPKLQGDVAVVAGGFHTEGLSQKLREAGISYVVIAPDLGQEAANENIYVQRIRVTPPLTTTESQTLSQYMEYLDDDRFDNQFPSAVQIAGETNNLMKAAEAIDRTTTQNVASPRSAGKMGVLAPTPQAGMTVEEFLDLSPDAQRAEFLKWATQKSGNPSIVAFFDAKDLDKYAAENPDDVAHFLSSRQNLLGVYGGDVPDEIIRGNTFQVLNAATLEEAVQSPASVSRIKRAQNRVIGVGKELGREPILTLPQIRGVLLLSEVILRSGINLRGASPELANLFWNRVQEIVQEFKNFEEISEAA